MDKGELETILSGKSLDASNVNGLDPAVAGHAFDNDSNCIVWEAIIPDEFECTTDVMAGDILAQTGMTMSIQWSESEQR